MSDSVIIEVNDFLVDIGNPEAFENTLASMVPKVLAQVVGMPEPIKRDGYYVVRVFGDPAYFLFALERQGYGKVIGKCKELT